MSKTVRISKRSREVLDALAEVVVPDEPGRPGAKTMKLVDRLLEFLGGFSFGVTGFVLYCRLWEWSPLVTGRFTRLSRLSPAERTEVLEWFEKSRVYGVRMSLMGVKGVMMASFYNNPEVWPLIGYEQGCLSEPPNPVKD
jgi:hypothetical protein